jgi:hypothetical protein
LAFSPDVFLGVFGQGHGTVTSSPGGINCEPTCDAIFARGTTVTLTAQGTIFGQPDGFNGWGDDGLSAGKAKTCTLVMAINKFVSAFFFCPECIFF